MRSATALSYELDDIQIASEELTEQIFEQLTFQSNSVAILHAQPDMDTAGLSRLLHEKLGCPVLGGTTAAGAVLSNAGYHELAVVLHVLSADDCTFSTAISSSLLTDPKKRLEDTYNTALNDLNSQNNGQDLKMVFYVGSLVPSYSSDDTVTDLAELCGGLPVFGYIAADDFAFSKQQVFLNGECQGDVLALLLIAGNIRPIFEVKNLAGSQVLSKRHVTRAKENIIYEIDGKPAYEYIKDFPFINEEDTNLWNYQFFVEMKNEEDDDGVLVSRALNTFDAKSGEISCFANVPENSYIGLLYCQENDVKESCQLALEELNEKIKNASSDGYQYTTVFSISCSLRNLFLANQKDAEGNLIKQIIPAALTTSGVYGYGEVAPTSMRDEKAVNRFHNATITICAL